MFGHRDETLAWMRTFVAVLRNLGADLVGWPHERLLTKRGICRRTDIVAIFLSRRRLDSSELSRLENATN
ncbi:hypothetical protein BST27_29510 [Mycobacterium intermedium]|uniref:Uncharacterized protein n=1 Tax=Mycobacterium intermedium TaxID=28445 RepID=A0A1T3VUA8_MYCIE|nr:hypothetical protein BV508_29095 [Mycobacterium intermedium]ORA90705.1 hypothetical protein BST27_29510 [Mycobacterium intermedium]